ncbi:MAG: alpha/beta fold hydrolase [Myxococcales bacterium]|nr:alpha/beta fold hydrolase [Myxococcales bacterium]
MTSPSGPLGWLGRLVRGEPIRRLERSAVGQDLTSGRDSIEYLRNLARGNRIVRRTELDQAEAGRPPVLLLHGYLGTRGSMYVLERRLAADGRCVFSFNLGALNTRDIRRSAFLIHRKIETILAQAKLTQIDIVGHSMGGLIGLYYVKKLGGFEKVRRLVMLGTPLTGTWIALAGVATVGVFSSSAWQLLPRSDFLRELETGPLPPGVEYFTIAAQRDWVCPPSSTHLDGAVNLTVPLGHSSLVMSEEVYERVHWALAREPEARGESVA